MSHNTIRYKKNGVVCIKNKTGDTRFYFGRDVTESGVIEEGVMKNDKKNGVIRRINVDGTFTVGVFKEDVPQAEFLYNQEGKKQEELTSPPANTTGGWFRQLTSFLIKAIGLN